MHYEVLEAHVNTSRQELMQAPIATGELAAAARSREPLRESKSTARVVLVVGGMAVEGVPQKSVTLAHWSWLFHPLNSAIATGWRGVKSASDAGIDTRPHPSLLENLVSILRLQYRSDDFSHAYPMRFAPVAKRATAGTTSVLSTAAQVARTAEMLATATRPRLIVAHLSTRECTVSSLEMPASADASVREALARLRSFSSSFLLTGSPRRKVYGTSERRREADVA